ncbi:uncharacterized protein N7498_005518 [Penicillium cinerascens]|uniref:Ecp2 effector protein domain-containing protein n=1 Tax=Penicillium cinerascens TaxID=70096 RepID=A0A9W9MNP6_9EURO|nr:uncharacterized protein N7498_005518 [Penicillium cinerascens]KAJ5204639.1 hypothetical protein N7498_005518 [Penicillium cinerascens]
MYSIITLALLTTPIYAATSARVWAHFYPNCPGEPFSDMASYENYEETVPSQDITVGECANINVPSYEHNLVSAISVDAEMLSREHNNYFFSDGANCNITVHEVPECVDPPLITKEIRNGVEVSQCESRNFAAWSEVWVQLICDDAVTESLEDESEGIPRIDVTAEVQQANNVQTPGSNSDSWLVAQEAHSEIEPQEESRVDNAGHHESEQAVHSIMGKLAEKHSHFVSGKHNDTQSINGSHHNATASGNHTMLRRKLSVLRNRATRLY